MDDKKDGSASAEHIENKNAPIDFLPQDVEPAAGPPAAEGFSFKALFKKQSNEGFFREALDKYGHEGPSRS